MAKAQKKAASKKRGNYDEKLQVKGSFLDIVKASANAANKNNGKKKTP